MKKGFSSVVLLIVVAVVLITVGFVLMQRGSQLNNRLGQNQSSELTEGEEYEEIFEDSLEDLEEKISTSSATVEEIKEFKESVGYRKVYKDDRFNFKFDHINTWETIVWDWEDSDNFVMRVISINLNGKFIGQLHITPDAPIHVAKSTWLNGESPTEQVGSYEVDGILASKLRSDHVVNHGAFVYLWEKDGAVYNFFILAELEETAESLLDSFEFYEI